MWHKHWRAQYVQYHTRTKDFMHCNINDTFVSFAVYLDSVTNCNMLCFQLGNTATGAAIPTRSWNIKVTQYSCDFDNLAPDGCTQYFFGAASQTVMSYNFAGGQQLAEQSQSICVRRERSNCRICWSTTANTNADFSLNGNFHLLQISQYHDKNIVAYFTGSMNKPGLNAVRKLFI